MDETSPTQNGPPRESQRELIIFGIVSVALLVIGIVIGALIGSEPAFPPPEAPPTIVISTEGP